MKHELKCWPEYFTEIQKRSKTFEIRRNDREFALGDTLILKEWIPDKQCFSGKFVERKVTYVFPEGHFGLDKKYIIMSII
jgi:hypothetical protein